MLLQMPNTAIHLSRRRSAPSAGVSRYNHSLRPGDGSVRLSHAIKSGQRLLYARLMRPVKL